MKEVRTVCFAPVAITELLSYSVCLGRGWWASFPSLTVTRTSQSQEYRLSRVVPPESPLCTPMEKLGDQRFLAKGR